MTSKTSRVERLVYAILIALLLAVLGLMTLMPPGSLKAKVIYQEF